MLDVTDRFRRYQACLVELWNRHFLPHADEFDGEPDWEAFSPVVDLLLVKMVMRDTRARSAGDLVISIEPGAIGVLSTNDTGTYITWTAFDSSGSGLSLRYGEIFDFDVIGVRDFTYVKAMESPTTGRRFLIPCEFAIVLAPTE